MYLGLIIGILPLFAMEENRGIKRPYEQISLGSQSGDKKAKKDAAKEQEYVLFKTFDDKEIKILKSHVTVSSTLRDLVNDAYESERDKTIPIPLPNNEQFTKKRIKAVKKILKFIFNGEVTQEDEQIVNFLREASAEQKIVKKIIKFLDLKETFQDLINQNIYSKEFEFKAADSTSIKVPVQVVGFYDYFNTMLNAGLKESTLSILQTDLSMQDLTLLIELLNHAYSFEKQLSIIRMNKEQSENIELIEQVESLLVTSIAQKISNTYDDQQHNFLAIITQAHQWGLSFIVKAFLGYYYENASNREVYELIKGFPVDYYNYCFAPELINSTNVESLFKTCLQLFIVAIYNEIKINQVREKEVKEKESTPYRTSNTLREFLPCFKAFEKFISLNDHLTQSISEYAKAQLNYLLKEYDNLKLFKEGNKEVFEALEEIVRRFLIQQISGDTLKEIRWPKITGFFQEGWYAQLKPSYPILSFALGNLANRLTWNISDCFLLSEAFIYENLFFYKTDYEKLFEFNLNTNKTVEIDTIVVNKIFVGVTKDNFVFFDKIANSLIIQSRLDKKKVLLIPLGGQGSLSQLLLLNNEVVVVRQDRFIKLITYSLENNTFDETIIVNDELLKREIKFIKASYVNSESLEKFDDHSFVIGYPHGVILFVKDDGTYTIIRTKKTQSDYAEYIIDDHRQINKIFTCFDGKHLVIDYELPYNQGYLYEIWDMTVRKKIYESPVNRFRTLSYVFDGKLYFEAFGTGSTLEQFCPYIAPFEQLINYRN